MSLSDAMDILEDARAGNDVGGINQRVFDGMKINDLAMSGDFAANVSGTSGKRCPCKCASWSDHWGNETRQTLSNQKCSVRMCGQVASNGAHVFISGGGTRQYIIPFCGTHNGSSVTIAMALKNGVTAVAAYEEV